MSCNVGWLIPTICATISTQSVMPRPEISLLFLCVKSQNEILSYSRERFPFSAVSGKQGKKSGQKNQKKRRRERRIERVSRKIDVRHVIGERLSFFVSFFFSPFTRRVRVHSAPIVSLIQFRSGSRGRRRMRCSIPHAYPPHTKRRNDERAK